jgi:hypothetical protein
MNAERRFEQQWGKNPIEYELMGQDDPGVDPSQSEDNAREHEPYRVGQMNTPGDDGDNYRHHQQAYGAQKNYIHGTGIVAEGLPSDSNAFDDAPRPYRGQGFEKMQPANPKPIGGI